MVNLEKFLIEFDRDPTVFAPGDRVTGRLIVVNDDWLKVKEIYIQLRGDAHVFW